MSSEALQGLVASVAIVVQGEPPAGRRSKTTCVAPPPVDAVRLATTRRLAPGSSNVTVGGVESTAIVTSGVAKLFPAVSAITARRS